MRSEPEIDHAASVLRAGGLVGLPTETVYGLAADAENELAVRRLFAVKGRPGSHPVIVHLPSVDLLPLWARDVPESAHRLARAFWPGPLTLILRRTPRALDSVTGGQDTVGLRVPAHPDALAVLKAFGGGLAAPSANRFGRVSPTRAEHVRADLGADVDLVLDGGPCQIGIESTIVDLSGEAPALLRPGGLPASEIEAVLGGALGVPSAGMRAPGLLPSHYAPRAGVRLVAAGALERQVGVELAAGRRVAVLAPLSSVEALPPEVTRLEAGPGVKELARVLYARLREADSAGAEVVVVQLPPNPQGPQDGSGLTAAVLDRLARAAGGR